MTRFVLAEFRTNFSPRQKCLYRIRHGRSQPWMRKLRILRFNVITLSNPPLPGQSAWKRDVLICNRDNVIITRGKH